MRYLISIVYLIFCISNTMQAQQKFDFDSTILVGNDQSIFGNRFLYINSNNDKYILGTYKNLIQVANFQITTISNINHELSRGVFLAKMNSNNECLWLKKIAESDSIVTINSCMDNMGNLLLGLTYRTTLYKYNDTIYNMNKLGDFILLKIDSSGNELFTKRVASPCFETITAISTDNDNNIYFAGQLDNNINTCPTYFDSILVQSSTYTFLAKLDELGNYLWVKNYSIYKIEKIELKDDFIYIIGNAGENNNNIGGLIFSYPNSYLLYFFLAKSDSLGNGIWVRRFGIKYNNNLGIMGSINLFLNSSKIYLTAGGSHQNQLEFLFDGGPNLLGIAGASTFESFVACYDTAGNFKWRKLVPDVTYPSQLTVDSNSNVIGIGGNDFTLKVFSYDSTGAFNWQAVSDADNLCTTVGSGITQDTHGKLYIVGGTTCNPLYMGNDTLHPPVGQSTLFYASLDSINAQWAVNTQDINSSSKSIRIYPNPANNLLVIENIDANVALKTITISNIQAQVVYKTTTTENKININTSTLPNGVYSIQYKTNKEFVTQKIIIQH